jgi:GxxExxY protein
MKLIFEKESFAIIGAAQEVHKELGCGFLEAVYREAVRLEFEKNKIPFSEEKEIKIHYKSNILSKTYCADFICYDKIIVELKALSKLNTEHDAQVLNYLKASRLKVGLLLNFGESSLKVKRIIL